MKQKISDAQWQAQLTEEVYRVCRCKGTERPFSGQYVHFTEQGEYVCTCCGERLFSSVSKFDAGCGWPSFFEPISEQAVRYSEDLSHGMIRTEVACASCDAHLGHVFDDGPAPTGQRFCINSVSLSFSPAASND